VLDLARRLVAQPKSGRTHLPGERPLSQSRILRDGLKAGSAAPAFSLPDVNGNTVALETYRGRRLLLVFTDPDCGPCDAVASYLARLGRQDHDSGLSLVLVARGSAEENQRKAERYELNFPVALQKRWEVSGAYGVYATPVGFLIDERGVIVRDVAMGLESIMALAEAGLALDTGKELENGRAIR
jgi:peroxiredoxin